VWGGERGVTGWEKHVFEMMINIAAVTIMVVEVMEEVVPKQPAPQAHAKTRGI
jgi:hypothetical protein